MTNYSNILRNLEKERRAERQFQEIISKSLHIEELFSQSDLAEASAGVP